MSIGSIVNIRSSIIPREASENGRSNWCELEENIRVEIKSQQLKWPTVTPPCTYSEPMLRAITVATPAH